MSARLLPPPASTWEDRRQRLQRLSSWHLDGRAAAAVGTQGWQASLTWRQEGMLADIHLAGPLGVGAFSIQRTPGGISVNGAVPSENALEQVQERIGFTLPLDQLRYWLLGIPDPALPFELQRNDQDRAAHLVQNDWNVDYDRYAGLAGDVLPARLVLTRAAVRVRIVIDHWELQ